MNRMVAAFIGLALMLVAREAQAAKLIAVLPLDVRNTEGKLSKAAEASVEEMLRDAATNALSSAGWTVLTGETTIQVLRDNGVKAEECGNQSCHLEMAREIKAERFLSGNMQYVEGQFIASIRLIDTATGRILASERVSGKTVTALRESFEARADAFFAKGGMLEGVAPTATRAPTNVESSRHQSTEAKPATGALQVVTNPKEGVPLLIRDPNGNDIGTNAPYINKAAAPGRWTLVAKAAGYEEQTQTADVVPDGRVTVLLVLKRLGGLSIASEPPDATVEITGPAGFHDEGGLPWKGAGLASGTYRVKVSRQGYAEKTEIVEVATEKTTPLKVVLQKAASSKNSAAEKTNAIAEDLISKGIRQVKDGELQAGIRSLTEAAELKPETALLGRAYRNLGVAHARAGNTKQAVYFYRQYLKVVPDAPERERIERLIAAAEK